MSFKISSIKYDLQRFGISPSRVLARLNKRLDNIFVISIPKSGTHFLESIFINVKSYRRSLKYKTIDRNNVIEYGGLKKILSHQRNTIYISHLPHDNEVVHVLKENKAKLVFVYRDPRDTLMSDMSYISSSPTHKWHSAIKPGMSRQERLQLMISGDTSVGMHSLLDKYDFFKDWPEVSGIYPIQFERLYLNIVQGNLEALKTQLAFLDLDDQVWDKIIKESVNSSSPTFAKPGIEKYKRDKDFPIETYQNVVGNKLSKFEFNGI